MVSDMVMRRILADAGRAVAPTQRPTRLPAGAAGRAGLGAVLLLVLSAGAALGGSPALVAAMGASLGLA
jgi:hypothetical protein